MTLELARQFLLWCTIINYVILMVWWIFFVIARDWVQGIHGKWFRLSDERFDAAHYSAMALYKIMIRFFNLVPLVVLYIIR